MRNLVSRRTDDGRISRKSAFAAATSEVEALHFGGRQRALIQSDLIHLAFELNAGYALVIHWTEPEEEITGCSRHQRRGADLLSHLHPIQEQVGSVIGFVVGEGDVLVDAGGHLCAGDEIIRQVGVPDIGEEPTGVR